jgi:D-alanyl-D-alanine dipeptidase
VRLFFVGALFLVAAAVNVFAQQFQIPLVDIRAVDPTIIVDLRYASANNITRRPIYPTGTRALIRPEVAQRLVVAQRFLRRYDCRLKIWDAYRPREAQLALWNASPKNDFVANPGAGAGSLHSWGLAVDATLADRYGTTVSMPTDFDDFTPAAMWRYTGTNEIIRHHLTMLQMAMREAGFYGIRSEWWHFTSQDWQQLMPPDEARRAVQAFSQAQQQQQRKL